MNRTALSSSRYPAIANGIAVSLATILLPVLLFAPTRAVGQTAIYGIDNRRDEHQITDKSVRALGDSTVMLVRRANVTELTASDGSRFVALTDPGGTFGNRPREGEPRACNHEPFRQQPSPGFCSGFLVAPDVIVTAGHCIDPNDATDMATRIVFTFAVGDPARPNQPEMTLPADEVYTIQRVLGRRLNSADKEDWAAVQLDRVAGGHVPLGVRRTGTIAANDDVLVIGHPAGLPRKYAGGASVVANGNTVFFETNLDTFGGNSGSAVFNLATGEVEGVLVRGDDDYCPDSANSCWFSCTYPQNPASCAGTCEEATRITRALNLIPRSVFVDGAHTGPQTGERREPFLGIAAGISSIKTGGGRALVVAPGTYPENLTLRDPVTIYNREPLTDAVVIGR